MRGWGMVAMGLVGCGSPSVAGDGPLADSMLVDAALADRAVPPDGRLQDGPFPDAPAPDAVLAIDASPLAVYCRGLRRDWAALVQGIDQTCTTSADCWLFGFARYADSYTCDCIASIAYPQLHVAARISAYPAAAAALEDAFIRDCAVQAAEEIGWTCDSGLPEPECVVGHCGENLGHNGCPP